MFVMQDIETEGISNINSEEQYDLPILGTHNKENAAIAIAIGST